MSALPHVSGMSGGIDIAKSRPKIHERSFARFAFFPINPAGAVGGE